MKAKSGAALAAAAGASALGPRVVLAWEHGLHYGHVSRLAAAAEVVERHGGRPVWALPRTRLQKAAFFDPSHERIEAPDAAVHRPSNGAALRSFADVLMHLGFEEVSAMAIRVRSWMRLFEQLAPACVILDCAPAAQLASQLMGLRCFQLTNGFDAPPARCPEFDVDGPPSQLMPLHAAGLAALERNLQRTALLCTGRREVTMASFLAYPQKVFDGLFETDPYGPRSLDWCVGPLGAPPHALRLSWPEQGSGSQARAGLHARHGGRRRGPGRSCQSRSGLPVRMARRPGPGAGALRALQRADRVRDPIAADLLPQADAVLGYGATNFVCQSPDGRQASADPAHGPGEAADRRPRGLARRGHRLAPQPPAMVCTAAWTGCCATTHWRARRRTSRPATHRSHGKPGAELGTGHAGPGIRRRGRPGGRGLSHASGYFASGATGCCASASSARTIAEWSPGRGRARRRR